MARLGAGMINAAATPGAASSTSLARRERCLDIRNPLPFGCDCLQTGGASGPLVVRDDHGEAGRGDDQRGCDTRSGEQHELGATREMLGHSKSPFRRVWCREEGRISAALGRLRKKWRGWARG